MKPQLLLDGLCFGEGPRWRDGHLWLSDMHAHQVLRMAPDGRVETIVEVPNCPSGLGWLPNDELLIVSMEDRQVLRYDGTRLQTHADLSQLADFHCNDMVVDAAGRAYVGNFGFDLHGGENPKSTHLICVEPNGESRVVAQDVMFPNGAVITANGTTLILAETFANCLSAFSIEPNGDLGPKRTWAELPEGAVPDGICLDAGGGIWVASPTSNNCLRLTEGGVVTHEVALDRGAFACMLSETDLYILASKSSTPEAASKEKSAQVLRITAPYAGAGYP